MTQVRVSDPHLLQTIVEDLRQRPDVVAGIVGPNTIEVSIMGSYNLEAMNLAIYLRVRAWEAAQRAQGHDIRVELL